MEFVVWDFVFFDEFLHLFEGPVGEWVDLVIVVGGVPFDDVDRPAVHALISSQAGYPGVERCECSSEGFDFAHSAAEFSVGAPLIEEVVAFFFNHFGNRVHFGIEEFDVDSVAEFGLVEERVGFGWQAQCVEGHEPCFGVDGPVDVEECLVFESEARHLGCGVAECLVGPVENFFGCGRFEFSVYLGELGGGEFLSHVLGCRRHLFFATGLLAGMLVAGYWAQILIFIRVTVCGAQDDGLRVVD